MSHTLRRPEDVSGYFYRPVGKTVRPCKLLSVDKDTETVKVQPSHYADGKWTTIPKENLHCSCEIENVGKSRSGDRWALKSE